MSEIEKCAETAYWSLSGRTEESGAIRQIPIHCSPFLVGRRTSSTLSLACPSVSKMHAEVRIAGGSLLVRDLSSTNGTFINGVRITEEVALQSGDLLQFGNMIFQVQSADDLQLPEAVTVRTDSSDSALALVQFDRLMTGNAVEPVFQPIVDLASRDSTACEVLGRSRLYGVRTPHAMFQAAMKLQQESQLSQMLRFVGVQAGAQLPGRPCLFLNTHPREFQEPKFFESLRELRNNFPAVSLTLEIHESISTEQMLIRKIYAVLCELEIGLAYDDFGAGQSRLVELADVAPDVLKFDIALIHGIDRAPAERHNLVAALVRMASELGATPLAEGVETEAEARTCGELGFKLAQGFYFGHPVAARDYREFPTFAVGASTV